MVIVASFIVIGVSGAAIVTAASRFEPTVVDDALAILAPEAPHRSNAPTSRHWSR